MLVNGNSYLATEIEKRKMEIIITLRVSAFNNAENLQTRSRYHYRSC
jgi:hypothetical protein